MLRFGEDSPRGLIAWSCTALAHEENNEMQTPNESNRHWLVAGMLILAAVFLIDVMYPLGAVMGTLYVLVSLCALRASARHAMILALAATFANVIAYCFAPTVGIPVWIVGANRFLAVCTTWLVIVISLDIHQQLQMMIARLRLNNQRLRLAMEGAELGFWDENVGTGEMVFDEHWIGRLGYKSHEVRHAFQWFQSLIHPEDRQAVQSQWEDHLAGKSQRIEVEHRLRSKQGDWRRILTKGRVIVRHDDGKPLRVAGTQVDVTETRELQLQAQEALRRRTKELQLVTDAIPMMIGYVDSDLRFQFNNHAYQQAYGKPLEAIKGTQLVDLLSESVFREAEHFFKAALAGERVQFEQRVNRPDGTYWWLVHLLPRRDEEDRVVGFYSLITDLTGLKQSQEEVDQQREALSLHNCRSAANEMAAAIAHELNQPLATISVYAAQLLRMHRQEQDNPAERSEALAVIDAEAQRAGEIMRRVRALVDNHKLQPDDADIRQLMESVHRICEFRAVAAKVRVQLRVEDSVETISCDKVQLQQLLVNLVTNAIEASTDLPEDRREVTVEVSAEREAITFRVMDQGHGLTPEAMKQVFQPHFSTKPDGLGIGLNICKSIATAHGGHLWATQNAEVGSTFHVLLPKSPAEQRLEPLVTVSI